MAVLILKVPRSTTLESLACHIVTVASEAKVKVVSSPAASLSLIVDGVVVTDPIAIARALVASNSKSFLYPKKLPKQTAVDSLLETFVEMFSSIRAARENSPTAEAQEAYKRTLTVLNQLAATLTKGVSGIANTKLFSIADMFAFSAAYAVFGPGPGNQAAAKDSYPFIAQWFQRVFKTARWVSALDAANVKCPNDCFPSTISTVSKNQTQTAPSKTRTQGNKSLLAIPSNQRSSARPGPARPGPATTQTKKFVGNRVKNNRDICWKPLLPPGHSTFSWPKRQKFVTKGGTSKVGSTDKMVPTPVVSDPKEWTELAKTSKKPSVRLPVKGKKNILITSALPYVNNVPHLGNIIGCVLSADVYARYCRLRGYNSIYICGTDEYGTTTEMKAIAECLTEQQICDKYHAIHKEIYEWFNIGFDHFGRTTTPEQTEIAQDIYKACKANGFIIEKETEQLYDTKINKFLADRYVEGICPKCGYDKARGDQCDNCGSIDYSTTELKNPISVLTKQTPEIRKSKHLYLDLPQVSKRLDEFVNTSKASGLWTENAIRETNSWIHKRGLLPRCITRDLKWGTPVPEKGYEDKVFYVWFDAPIGYISITANYTKQWQQWWKNPDVSLVQFMGKDNIPFHTVIFPSTLIAASGVFPLTARAVDGTLEATLSEKGKLSLLDGESKKELFSTSLEANIAKNISRIEFATDAYVLRLIPASGTPGIFSLDRKTLTPPKLPKLGVSGREYTLLHSISVCDYLQYEGGLKFSKSRGTGVFGNHAKETKIPACVWRYYLLSVRPENQDTQFDWQSLMERNNGELIANFGNFINRCVNFLGRIGGVIPEVKMEARDREFFTKVEGVVNEYCELMEGIQIKMALRKILEVSRLGNQLLQHEAPWALMKEGKFVRTKSVLGISLNLVWLLATLAEPFMPSVSVKICKQLQIPPSTLFLPGISEEKGGKTKFKCKFGPPLTTWAEAKIKGGLFVGHKIGKAVHLFQRIEAKSLPAWRQKYGGAGSGTVSSNAMAFPFLIIVSKIVEAVPHPSADHLAVLKIELGPGKGSRSVVSGIRKEYPKLQHLLNKTVLTIENVKASNFKGVKTQALLLCAETPVGKRVIFLPDGTPPGAKIVPNGATSGKKKLASKDFKTYPMVIDGGGKILFKTRALESGTKGFKFPALNAEFRKAKVVI